VNRGDFISVQSSRRRAANYIKEHFFTPDDGMLEIQHVHPDSRLIITFFEHVGHLRSMGVLQDESVWYRFGRVIRAYWALYRPAIEKMRQEAKDPMVMEDFEKLNDLMADIDRKQPNNICAGSSKMSWRLQRRMLLHGLRSFRRRYLELANFR